MLDPHFGLSLAGAILNTVNTRLDVPAVAGILRHARTRVFIVHAGFAEFAAAALKDVEPRMIVIDGSKAACEVLGSA